MLSEIDPEELSKIMKRLDVKMDDLVVKLKHMDYRDFLAVNKYILESKKSEEYHITARGKVLSAAMKK
jgi:ribosomal protein S18